MIRLPAAPLKAAADLTTDKKGRRAASRLGDVLGSRLSEASHPRVDVHSLAASEDIEVVQVGVLPESGRAEWTASGLRIVLSKNEGRRRQRFTLAHELAHHLIFGIAREGARTSSEEEETRCDKFAAALLMPEESFRNSLRRHRNLSRLSAVRALAEEFDASLQAAMFRLDDLSLMDTDSILLMCEVDSHGDYRVRAGAYDRSTYGQLEQLTTQSLGIEDPLAPEMFVRLQLPTKQGRLPHGSLQPSPRSCRLPSTARRPTAGVGRGRNGIPLTEATIPKANDCGPAGTPRTSLGAQM